MKAKSMFHAVLEQAFGHRSVEERTFMFLAASNRQVMRAVLVFASISTISEPLHPKASNLILQTFPKSVNDQSRNDSTTLYKIRMHLDIVFCQMLGAEMEPPGPPTKGQRTNSLYQNQFSAAQDHPRPPKTPPILQRPSPNRF